MKLAAAQVWRHKRDYVSTGYDYSWWHTTEAAWQEKSNHQLCIELLRLRFLHGCLLSLPALGHLILYWLEAFSLLGQPMRADG